jgi:undecaprenyl-diphosphatase
MIETLNSFDTKFFLFLNQFHSPFFDRIMWWISSTSLWIPLYLFLAGWIIYHYRKSSIILFVGIALTILLSDRISSGIIKPSVARLRPTHTLAIQDKVHTVNNYKGGKYGFVSSHAANCFAIALFMSLLLKKKKYYFLFFLWALIVSYSRIYLGVHYPGDIIGGALVGLGCAGFVFYLIKRLKFKLLEDKL